MRGSIPSTGSPNRRTSPLEGRARPVTRFSVVDLPQPVGPTTATNSPRATLMLKSRIAVIDRPSGVRKRRLTLISSIAGLSSGAVADMASPSPAGRRSLIARGERQARRAMASRHRPGVADLFDVLHELGSVGL